MTTTTLYNIIKSELIKNGHDEFISSDGDLVIFDERFQFMTKILEFDEDVQEIVNRLFTGVSLTNRENDLHFKRAFLTHFLNRQINRQTVESFRIALLSTFITNQTFINSVYTDLDKYITQTQTTENTNKQTNDQTNTGTTTSDNRQAYAQLPQNNVQLDVNSTVMDSANDNTISRNKQTNEQNNAGEVTGESKTENKSYQFDELFKSNGLLEQILNIFDSKCFLQFW